MAKSKVGNYACYVREAKRPLSIEAKSKKEAINIARILGYSVRRCMRLSKPKKIKKRIKGKYF